MPSNLKELVEGILSDLKQKCQPMAHKAHFPPMEPDTCIVNWYSTSGSLGVHQDLDESDSQIILNVFFFVTWWIDYIIDLVRFVVGDGLCVPRSRALPPEFQWSQYPWDLRRAFFTIRTIRTSQRIPMAVMAVMPFHLVAPCCARVISSSLAKRRDVWGMASPKFSPGPARRSWWRS